MGLGVFTAVCSITKTAEFNRIRETTDPTCECHYIIAASSPDFADVSDTDEIAPLMIWGV